MSVDRSVPPSADPSSTKSAASERIRWRAIWALIKPFWFSEDKWKARGLLFAVIALSLGMVYLDVLFNAWNRDFYNALEEKNWAIFREQLWRFSYLAFIFIAVAIYKTYLTQALEIRWRGWMTKQYLDKWLANQTYYRIEQTRSADNPDQRIAEDLNQLSIGTLDLALGLLSSVVTLASFIGILWQLSGAFSFEMGQYIVTLPAYMVWFALAYAVVGSGLVWLVARKLVPQNFFQQRYEADFRFNLVRLRENAEAVALYRGETQEHAHLDQRFERIRANWWTIMRTTKRLNVASTFYAQFAVIFPFLVAAPRYFSGAIKLGGLMQIASAFKQVQTALSWFIEAFTQIAQWKASVNRLAGFNEAVDAAAAKQSDIQVLRNNVGAILLDRVALSLPNEMPLAGPMAGTIYPGQRLLISGPSGCGKSTLLRAIAGIWPYGSGSIEIPISAKLLFIPQKPYLPIGPLRAALAYPAPANAYKDRAIIHYLEQCRLAHLADRLEEEDNWSARLSPGEQQRLAFVRMLLAQPDFLFLDEATSALDADTEDALYQLVLQTLPHAAIVSIAHRESVGQYHDSLWQFERVDDDTTSQHFAVLQSRPDRIETR